MSLVLVVTERYWPDGSGGELATHLILDILRKRFDVTVVIGTKNPSELPSVRYVYEPLLSKREKPILWLKTLRLVHTQRFQKLIRKSDVVYIPRFAFPIISYAKKLGKKVVVHLHDYIPISYTATVLAPYEEHKRRITLDNIRLECMKSHKHCIGASLLWWLSKLARKQISQADKIICVSKRQAEIIADQAPELRDKIEVVYNPLPPEIVNAEPRKKLDDTPTFLYVGGDSYVKGFHTLLKAVKELGKQKVKARIILAGEYGDDNLKTLNELRSRYPGLEVSVLGRVSHDEVLKLYEKAWGLVFPSSVEEPLPYAVVEAMALGTIPIASSVGSVPEIIGDCPVKKFLFKPGSIGDLIEKLKIFTLQSKESILGLAMECKNRIVELFNKENIERKIVEVFKEFLN
ncbi:MAG: glycosyltransferase [Desulfurococcales archaeon]|jgi:glycosyltransferase involved in cell wall biosynthesis|nr:glycosyltransferase [Desulfurococcales archaeon]